MNLADNEKLPMSLSILLIRRYDSLTAGQLAPTRQRRVKSYEMSYYLSSEGGKININNTEYLISKGCVRLVKPGDLVFSTPHFSCITVVFEVNSDCDGEGKQPQQNNSLLSEIPSFLSVGADIESLFCKELEAGSCNGAEGFFLQASYLLRILASLYRFCCHPKYTPAIDRCIRYMKENLSQKITLEQLGRLTGYSPLHLRRMFSGSVGKTPHMYLTDIRIEKAKKLLETSNTSLDEISVSCGFRSLSHFKTVFKQFTGNAPGSYRKKMSEYL